MFNSFKSPTTSPCPSPIRDLATTIKRASSPRREKYKTFVESQEPIYSKGRLTMTGGFTDFRPRPYYLEKVNSLDSNGGTPSLSSSRSTSCDSGDAIMEPQVTKQSRCFVKIPRESLMTVIGHLSPQLSKKLRQAEKSHTPPAPINPTWPTMVNNYGRAISTSSVQTLVVPMEPSLTAMKAQALLDESRDIRTMLQLFARKNNLQRQEEEVDNLSMSSGSDKEEHEDEPCNYHNTEQPSLAPSKDIISEHDDLIRVDISSQDTFPINPNITVKYAEGSTGTPNTSEDEGFLGETLLEALDLEALPTLSPEELVSTSAVNEVRNVHLVCDYIVLETAPPSDSVFV